MNNLNATLNRILSASIVGALMVLCVGAFPAARAQDDQVLHGRVQALDHVVRLQRPKTPLLEPSAPTRIIDHDQLKANVDFGDSDFSRNLRKPSFARIPLMEGAARQEDVEPLSSSADDDEMVIAWEAWHKRVCQAIYERWVVNSKVRGVAHTTLRFTRDHRIFCDISDIAVEPVALNRFPPGFAPSEDALEDEFHREIMDTIQSLQGSPLLEFPPRSKRMETSFSPYFKKMGDGGYDWRKDDYERVKLN